MSYNIKFDDITSVQVESQKTINAWGESVASLNKAMTDFINNQNLQGQAISSMRRYLVEVHGTLLQTLVNLMNDYSTNLLLYKDGYYQIDSHLHTKLPGQEFTRLHSDLKGSRDKLKNEIEVLNTTKDKISDLVSYDGSSHTKTVMDYNFLLNQIKNLDSSITQYESNHASQDLVAFKELLAATKALITEHAGKTRTVGTYQSGDFAKLKSVQRFAIAYKQATQQMESRVERVKAAQERDKVRFEALAAEDRAKNGWKELGLGVLTFAIGFIAIIGTMGTATPLVVAGGIVGFGTTAYGLSNMYEAGQDIKLGNAGDIQTKAGNPIRDTLFMGNDKLYHDVGNVFTTASAIMIPIGQTGSVVKGLTQFAIGEASAYTAGQVAYHGTKLVGGSEEDAQTANFIGNIVGGFVASSAASKFSLNKVKVEVEAPKYNKEQILKNLEESRLARESSKFRQYVAKEKSIIDSWNQNTSKFKMYNMDDLAKPKYNREQILRNIEESRLARESSNFKQYVAKEYALAEEIRYKNYWNEPILQIPKGSRPDPKTYVNSEYLTKHFAEFDEGATVIQTESAYTHYSEANGFVGVPDDNTLFVMPTKYADKVIKNSNGNINYIEEKLGFPKGYFKYGGGLVRIDIEDLSDLDLRLPSGNETGANPLWIPGGETSGGVPEAILNTVPLDKTRVSRIGIK